MNRVGRPKYIVNVGDKIGCWTITKILPGEIDHRNKSVRQVLCRCECGTIRQKSVNSITNLSRPNVSCGCIKIVHGMSRHNTRFGYGTWNAMRARCSDPKHASFHLYGGRGIKVCDRWNTSFRAFLEDMGPRPSFKYTLDRYPNKDGDYEPNNCRWATYSDQGYNRRDTVIVEHGGQAKNTKEWSLETGIPAGIIYQRIWHGWTPERALTTPVR